jgi:hypothetical protein
MSKKSDWMNEEYGIPHKNGMVRFYLVSWEEDVSAYLGWYDMTDWDKGWEKVWADAETKANNDQVFQVLRHDQLLDLKRNIDWALEEALVEKDETTFLWWWNKEKEAKAKGENKCKD